jgi:hypothetical protein
MHEKAAALLMAIWRGVPSDYKSRYRRSIWQQFEDNVRAASYTSNLGKFVNSICSKLGAQIKSEDSAAAEAILNGGDDRALLKLMREETTLLVLMVRVVNQERQERWKAEQAEREAEEAAMRQPGFGLPEGD